MLERFGFTGDRLTARIGDLSGGERRRFQLLRLLLAEPNVLLLDEPTNDLDIETLTVLEDFLDGWPGTLVVVSHDRYFLERVCDSVWALLGDGQVPMLPRGVDEYLERREAALRGRCGRLHAARGRARPSLPSRPRGVRRPAAPGRRRAGAAARRARRWPGSRSSSPGSPTREEKLHAAARRARRGLREARRARRRGCARSPPRRRSLEEEWLEAAASSSRPSVGPRAGFRTRRASGGVRGR